MTFMFPSINNVNLSILNHLNITIKVLVIFNSVLIEIFLSGFQTASHTYQREIFPIQLKLDAFCLSAEQNRTNRVD